MLAEFDGDAEALEAITVTALQRPGGLAHQGQRLRDQRDIEALRARTEQSLREQGVATVARDHDTWQGLHRLRWDADARPGDAITEEQHRDCAGHSAVVDAGRSWTDDALHAGPRWGCSDPAAHGHAPLRPDTDSGDRGGPMTEQEKADRRRVIANNKAWDSAQTVRRRWLRDLLAGPKPPADAAVFIAGSLGQAHYALARALGDRNELACDLLRLDAPSSVHCGGESHPIAAAAERASAPRATMLTLAVVLAGFEADTGRHTWRRPDAGDQRYLRQLRAWGYPLSEVEELVLGEPETNRSQDTDQPTHHPVPDSAPDPDSD